MPAPKGQTEIKIRVVPEAFERSRKASEEIGMYHADLCRMAFLLGLKEVERRLHPENYIPKDVWSQTIQRSIEAGELFDFSRINIKDVYDWFYEKGWLTKEQFDQMMQSGSENDTTSQ